jgi:hypothetical protein
MQMRGKREMNKETIRFQNTTMAQIMEHLEDHGRTIIVDGQNTPREVDRDMPDLD